MFIEIFSNEGVEMVIIERGEKSNGLDYITKAIKETPSLKQKATEAKIYDDQGNVIKTVKV